MKKIILTALIIFIKTIGAYSQNFNWVKSMGGTDSEYAVSMEMDASGNIYITGEYKGTVDFDPGFGVANLTSVGQDDIFVCKYNASGNFVWAKSFGGIQHDEAGSIALDAAGNVYITGRFFDTVDFDPGVSTYNLTIPGFYGDACVCKLNNSGSLVWVKQLGNNADEIGFSINVDVAGNVYTAGIFSGTSDFDPGSGTFGLTSINGFNVFVSKLDVSGSFVWAKQFTGQSDVSSHSIAFDAAGNILIAGDFLGTVDFDPGSGTSNLTSVNGADNFVCKLDTSGSFIWAKQFGGTQWGGPVSITLDTAGNIYASGPFEGTADFNPGSAIANLTSAGAYDSYISKLDASGNFIWAKQIAGSSDDFANGIATDVSGNIYVTGSFEGVADFDPGSGVFNLTPPNFDMFVLKLDSSGNFVWAQQVGGNSLSLASGTSIKLDVAGNIYTTGGYMATVDFDPGSGIFNLTASGGSDIFIHKMSQQSVGLSEINIAAEVSVYPNPTEGDITIDTKSGEINKATIRNSLGQIISSADIVNNLLNIELIGSPGLYFVELQTAKGDVIVTKVLKQ